jgi:DNA-binding GntR family transcriptional regulator
MEEHTQQKVTKKERVDSIHNTLRERICLLTYPPGSLLREVQLAEEFHCSRTPIREAIKRLEFEGLAFSKNGVGTLVTEANYNSLEDVYEMRLKVAELMGSMGQSQCTEQQIAQLKSLRADADDLIESDLNFELLAKINHNLHYVIGELIKNKALLQLYHLYYFQTTRVWYQKMSEFWGDEIKALRDELDELISAVSRNDITAVGYIKRNYISRVNNLLKKHAYLEKTS